MKVKRALLSVYDKNGIIELAKSLKECDVELIATGGTAKLIVESGLPCTMVEDLTGFPEIMSGRVKTLHPTIMGGILARRDKDLDELASHHIEPIDLVVVNLYPFEEFAYSGEHSKSEILEEIDIGGCSLLRAAAKNHPDVAVVSSPEQYGELIDRLRRDKGELDENYLQGLAREAFHVTAIYDSLIGRYFDGTTGEGQTLQSLPHFNLISRRAHSLRYGENPHQEASFYVDPIADEQSLASAVQLHGKELSYNNIMDLDSAVTLTLDLPGTACVIIKHTNPCGVGIGSTSLEAYQKALSTDPVSAFGSIIAFNKPVDDRAADEIRSLFVECVIAPSFSSESLKILKEKKNLRILELPGLSSEETSENGCHVRSVRGGLLVQQVDRVIWDEAKLRNVTEREATGEEMDALRLGWIVCKHIKSNGIVLATTDRTLGIGTGQMSRIDSVEIALMKARNANLSVENGVMASDAFFPFSDSVERVAGEGIRAIVQPGGSIRDEEVIQAADKHGIAMIFTGIRHFKH
jgi:phosphoribosylaminoimidazolecarboxamide formyltransferase/IMP cyclohydrolase